jgi:hypothetical protein
MKAALLAKLHRTTDAAFGQKVMVYPRTGGGYVADSIDTTRSAVEITAYFTRVADVDMMAAGGPKSAGDAQVRSSAITFKYITNTLPYEIRENDLIVMLEADRATYRVSRSAPFWMGRTIVFCVQYNGEPVL